MGPSIRPGSGSCKVVVWFLGTICVDRGGAPPPTSPERQRRGLPRARSVSAGPPPPPTAPPPPTSPAARATGWDARRHWMRPWASHPCRMWASPWLGRMIRSMARLWRAVAQTPEPVPGPMGVRWSTRVVAKQASARKAATYQLREFKFK